MPGRTCVAQHDQCLCQWKFAALSAYRNRSILQWENHFRCDLLQHHGSLQSDICAMKINRKKKKVNRKERKIKSWLILIGTVTIKHSNVCYLPGSMLLFGLCQYLQLVFAILWKWTNLRLQRCRAKNTNIIIGCTVHCRADGITTDCCTRNGSRNLCNSLVRKRRRSEYKNTFRWCGIALANCENSNIERCRRKWRWWWIYKKWIYFFLAYEYDHWQQLSYDSKYDHHKNSLFAHK